MLRRTLERRRRQILEAQRMARENPKAYALRLAQLMLVGRIIFAGFAMIPIVLFLVAGACAAAALLVVPYRLPALVACLVFTAAFSVMIPAISIIFGWSGDDSPAGLILARSDAPRMFEFLDGLRARLRSPRVERVYLTMGFNAAVVRKPASFGGGGCELILGIEMMKGLTVDEFSSVLAHELGHTAGAMNRRERRITNACMTWWIRAAKFDEAGILFRPLAGVSEAYGQLLADTAIAMRRTIEFEADRIGATALGERATAGALLNCDIRMAQLQNDFWPAIHETARVSVEPPTDVHARLSRFLAENHDPAIALGMARWSLAEVTRYDSSHPSTAERLERLGFAGDAALELVAPLGTRSAASELFGGKERDYTELLDGVWARSHADEWRDANAEWRARRFDFDAMARKGIDASGEEDALWKMAQLTENFEGRRSAYYHYRAWLERNMEDAKANFAFGRVLVEEGDAQGIPYILKAVDASPFLAARGLWTVCRHHYAKGEHAAAAECEAEYARHLARMHEAQDERAELCEDDELEPHDIGSYELELVRRKVADIRPVVRVWICRQKVALFPQHPQYIIAFEFDKAGLLMPQFVADALASILELDGDTTAIPTRRYHHRMVDRIAEVAGTPVFDRRNRAPK